MVHGMCYLRNSTFSIKIYGAYVYLLRGEFCIKYGMRADRRRNNCGVDDAVLCALRGVVHRFCGRTIEI